MSIHPHFKLVGIEPGMVITFQFGAVDFRENVPLHILEKLFNDGFPYLKLSKLGQNALNPNFEVPINNISTETYLPNTADISMLPPKPNKKKHARKNK